MTSRKLFIFIFVGMFLTLIMTGCWTLSVHPLYFKKDLTFEPDLIGTWGEEDSEENLDEFWIFKQIREKTYRLTIKVKSKPDAEFEAHLVKLGKHMFMDIYPEEPETRNDFYNAHVIPAHSICKFTLEGYVVTMTFIDSDWLEKGLKENKISIKHERRDDMIVLTAGTKELQEFVLKYFDEGFDTADPGILYRLW